MTPHDTDRIFDMLQKQGETLATIAQVQADTKERLFGVGNTPGLFQVVMTHNKQLTMMKGAASVLAVLWTAAVAVFAAIIKGHH